MGTIKVMTKAGDEREILEEQIITIREGLFGFPDFERYALIEYAEESPFYWMQSLDRPDLAFIVLSPTDFLPEYRLRVAPSELEMIEIKGEEDVVVLTIVTIPEDPRMMTANLQGPVVINRHSRAARQMISTDPSAMTKHRILPEKSSSASSEKEG